MRTNLLAVTLSAVFVALLPVTARAFTDKPPGPWTARNMRVVGYSEVNRRPPFKLAIHQVDGRWLLYMGHLWDRGWTIMDVTNPRDPKVVTFIPGPANTWTIQMDVEEGKMITALERIPPGWGGDASKPNDEGVLIWSLADPVHPKLLGQYKTGGSGTHRDGYFGGKYVHLAAGMPGYSGNIYVIIDNSDPAHPAEAGRWWVPGQWVAGGEKPVAGVSLHGPPYVQGNLAYVPFGAAGLVILFRHARVPDVLQCWTPCVRHLGRDAAKGGRLVHPAGSGPPLRSAAGGEPRRADRGRPRRYARVHLREQQEPGAVDSQARPRGRGRRSRLSCIT